MSIFYLNQFGNTKIPLINKPIASIPAQTLAKCNMNYSNIQNSIKSLVVVLYFMLFDFIFVYEEIKIK